MRQRVRMGSGSDKGLSEGDHGNILTIDDMGIFEEPKFYYRSVPRHKMELNPNLGPQLFGWE